MPEADKAPAVRGTSTVRHLSSAAMGTMFKPPAPPPPTVTVAKPVFRKITEWDEYTGRFIAAERVDVRARVSGYLESVHFAEGQMVEPGQLLFVIDQRPFEAEVARARAEVDRVSTQLKVAQLEYERGQRLESSRAMSRETMEERRARRDAAQAELRRAEADHEALQKSAESKQAAKGVVAGIAIDIAVSEADSARALV